MEIFFKAKLLPTFSSEGSWYAVSIESIEKPFLMISYQ